MAASATWEVLSPSERQEAAESVPRSFYELTAQASELEAAGWDPPVRMYEQDIVSGLGLSLRVEPNEFIDQIRGVEAALLLRIHQAVARPESGDAPESIRQYVAFVAHRLELRSPFAILRAGNALRRLRDVVGNDESTAEAFHGVLVDLGIDAHLVGKRAGEAFANEGSMILDLFDHGQLQDLVNTTEFQHAMGDGRPADNVNAVLQVYGRAIAQLGSEDYDFAWAQEAATSPETPKIVSGASATVYMVGELLRDVNSLREP